MNLRTILHHPGRIAATVVAAGLLFAAGTAAGSETTQPDTTQPRQDVPVASAADADTLYHYLTTLTPRRPRPDRPSPSSPTSAEHSSDRRQQIWLRPSRTDATTSTLDRRGAGHKTTPPHRGRVAPRGRLQRLSRRPRRCLTRLAADETRPTRPVREKSAGRRATTGDDAHRRDPFSQVSTAPAREDAGRTGMLKPFATEKSRVRARRVTRPSTRERCRPDERRSLILLATFPEMTGFGGQREVVPVNGTRATCCVRRSGPFFRGALGRIRTSAHGSGGRLGSSFRSVACLAVPLSWASCLLVLRGSIRWSSVD